MYAHVSDVTDIRCEIFGNIYEYQAKTGSIL